MDLLTSIRAKAKEHSKMIVLPEGTEERTIKAADQVIAEGLARITLIGNPQEIHSLSEKFVL